MQRTDAIRDLLPEVAKDTKLNLQATLTAGTLTPAQRWGVAVAVAAGGPSEALRDALVADALDAVGPAVVEDGLAAASVMAMNNVYYRFRHLIGDPVYGTMPARLRMNRLVKVATNRTDFELLSLAVSAVNGCEACLRAHEKVVLEGGLTKEQVHDAVRLAATVHAAGVSLQLAPAAAAVAEATSRAA